MNAEAFLEQVRADEAYEGQIVHVREEAARAARYAAAPPELGTGAWQALAAAGVSQLYTHQVGALEAVAAGRDVLVASGTASGKSLCYAVPLIERLGRDASARALLVFPTKALCQDQFRSLSGLLEAAGLGDRLIGVYDGDTPGNLRRRLRDQAAVVLTNPDMLHAALMPQHARWAGFLSRLDLLVLDELHVYSGIFGVNVAFLLRRLLRACQHYETRPQVIACSATVGNPHELAARLLGRPVQVVEEDGSPRGRRVYVFWNPPTVRRGGWRSRRSANVEAHELMARLIEAGSPTITFSKAKMTAEMIHRYAVERLRERAPHLAARVTPYRGGYLPEERRQIEQRLFSGELVGVSTTSALELGIDVGTLEACVIVGYPGRRASFFQQSGRAGRGEGDSLVILVGLDTTVNQYVMQHPEYVFEQGVEEAVIDTDNPFVAAGHLRCATHELPLKPDETAAFGAHAETVLAVLEESGKVTRIDGRWYHSAEEVPQHEVSLRSYADQNVMVEEVETGEVIGQLNKFDSEPIAHPGAVYMHRGDAYVVDELDLDHNVARVRRREVDYYTQPLGGTDIHHVDHRLREKPFGTGRAYWGEVTAYFGTHGYEKIHFYTLDALSQHDVDLPTMQLETTAFWLEPPEELVEEVRRRGLDPYNGLRGIGYATRQLLPLFMTCDVLDFSHTVGSVNSPWHSVFVYERYPHGLGFTEKAYERLDEIVPRVLEHLRQCSCADGCPACVGKPLRQYATWNVERGEASIPSKQAALVILEGYLGDGSGLRTRDVDALSDDGEARRLRLQRELRRRLERGREPELFHPIRPLAEIRTEYPAGERRDRLTGADAQHRAEGRRQFERGQEAEKARDRALHRRIAERLRSDRNEAVNGGPTGESRAASPAISLGDTLASRARRRARQQAEDGDRQNCGDAPRGR